MTKLDVLDMAQMGFNILGSVNTTQANGVASENPARRGRARRLWKSTIKGENEVWPDFLRNPKGREPISMISLSLVISVTGYSALLAP
jgi:hypothetical protein